MTIDEIRQSKEVLEGALLYFIGEALEKFRQASGVSVSSVDCSFDTYNDMMKGHWDYRLARVSVKVETGL